MFPHKFLSPAISPRTLDPKTTGPLYFRSSLSAAFTCTSAEIMSTCLASLLMQNIINFDRLTKLSTNGTESITIEEGLLIGNSSPRTNTLQKRGMAKVRF